MKGDGMDLLIRPAKPRDRADLAEISKTTWEGHDYLEGVADSWLADSGFIVGELSGRVVACGKISRMPGDVAWLEGLRVHSEFRGRGLGRIMSDRILEEALRLLEEGRFTGIEFSTYINNLESRAMAERQGFRITELFHVVGIEDIIPPSPPMELTPVDITPEDLAIYREHAPCGWKYIHARERDSLAWLRANAGIWQTPGGVRFLASKRDMEISPLSSAIGKPEEFIAGALAFVTSNNRDCAEIMIHDSHGQVIRAALKAGFSYWEEPGTANIPVYRYFAR